MKFHKVYSRIINESVLNARKSNEEIAKKHNVTVKQVERLIKIGAEVEHEHTKDQEAAETIASQHIYEILDYYSRLKKLENE
jgi:hypothetical protein